MYIIRKCFRIVTHVVIYHTDVFQLVELLLGDITTGGHEANGHGVLLRLLNSLFQGFTDRGNLSEDTLDFRPLFGPLFVVFLVVTENEDAVHPRHNMLSQ